MGFYCLTFILINFRILQKTFFIFFSEKKKPLQKTMSSSSSSSSMSLTKDTDPIVSQVPQETKGLDETMEEPNMVHLVSKQGNKFSIDLKYAMASNLVKQALDADKVSKDVDCPQVTTEILGEVVKYLNHHKGVEMTLIERPLRSKVMKDVLKDTWDAEFIDRIGEDRQTLYDLVLVS